MVFPRCAPITVSDEFPLAKRGKIGNFVRAPMSNPAAAPSASESPRTQDFRSGAIRITVIYVVFALIWLGLSIGVFSRMTDTQRVLNLQTAEYVAFVLCTGLLIFVLVGRFARGHAAVEEELRRNERRYRSLVFATAQVTWRADASGEIHEDMPTWAAFTGQTPAQFKGWGWMEVIHPDDRPMLTERWRKAIARESKPPNDRFYEIEYRVRRHDGVYRNFLSRTVPVLDADGSIAEWVGICYDVTEQKEREEQLRDSEARYRSLVEVAPDVIFVHQEGKVIFMNPAGLRMLRLPGVEAILGCPALELAHPDGHEMVRQRIEKLTAGGTVPTREQKLRRFDGTYVDAEIDATGFIYQGRPAVQVIARDITARRQAEEELRASENRFHLVTRATTDVVYDWDMSTDAIWWNENMRHLFGYDGPPSELGIAFWTSLLHPEDRERVNAGLSGAVSGGEQFWADEYRFRRSDGSYANVLDRGFIVRDPAGQAVRMIGAMMDITDRKLTEQRLRDSRGHLRALTAHLERVREEERTRIAREIHDELGQALTGLKMDLSWFASRLPHQPLLEEKSLGMLKLIDSTVHAVRRLSTELRPAILDNLGLVPAIEWMAQEFQKRTGVTCQFTTTEDDLVLDQERTTALFRICQEALTNVTRYAQATGVHIILEANDEQVTLRVTDNGRGITQGESKKTNSFGLLGMRERARLLGGTFAISGAPGRGTTLTVCLPSPQPAPMDSPA